MNTLIESNLVALKKQSFPELEKLPSHQGKKFDGKITLSVWKDTTTNQELRIVVQAYRHLILGIGRMEAKGFVISRAGEISDLTKEEIYEFT
ncbi:hypothetical protein [Stenotrophomonas acidaminiphila]|jgi:hypothetical protein